MTIKKKPLIITGIIILALIAIAITLFLVFGKERVNVKIVELPKEVGEFKLKSMNYLEFVETEERMNEILAGEYIKLEDYGNEELFNQIKRADSFQKYNEKFFEKSFIFITSSMFQYNGFLHTIPEIKNKRSYVSREKKLVIEVEITNEPTKDPMAPVGLVLSEIRYPHGFIIEIPRKQFEKYNMTYDDIEIVYLNSHDEYGNVQYGGDKFRLDPNYPQPIGFDYSKLKE